MLANPARIACAFWIISQKIFWHATPPGIMRCCLKYMPDICDCQPVTYQNAQVQNIRQKRAPPFDEILKEIAGVCGKILCKIEELPVDRNGKQKGACAGRLLKWRKQFFRGGETGRLVRRIPPARARRASSYRWGQALRAAACRCVPHTGEPFPARAGGWW